MVLCASGRQGMPHLFSGLIALGVAAAVLFGGGIVAVHLEHATIVSTAPELFPLKKQGLAFQSAAAHARSVLPLYGSSELVIPPLPERASIFFRTAPTGFQVSPVGAGGASSLSMLQKIAALGSDLRAKKLTISLSPGWFLRTRWDGYEGGFSLMAASEVTFGTALDFKLKRDIASRMLKYPATLQDSPFLEFALKRLASGRLLDRVVFCALWPLGKLQTAIPDVHDDFAAITYIRQKMNARPPSRVDLLDWATLNPHVSGPDSADGRTQ